MSVSKLAVWSERLVTSEKVTPGGVLSEDGTIKTVVFNKSDIPEDYTLEDQKNLVVMPAMLDPHVHINEPGRTDWEGFVTGTKAACAGGVACIVDMPLNCDPVTISEQALQVKLESLKDKLWVDCGFWGGLVPENLDSLSSFLSSGILGIKCFLTDSGLKDFPKVQKSHLEYAMPIIAKSGLPLLVHAELESCIGSSTNKQMYQYSDYLKSRPDQWEFDAIEMLVSLAKKTACRTHIVHLSSSTCLPLIEKAKNEGVPITVETCPHYLHLTSELIGCGDTRFKCAPPIRSRRNRDNLWKGLLAGTIDFIASDHSPCVPELKYMREGQFQKAWGGISSIQLSLPIVWTELRKKNLPLTHLVNWLCKNPAQFIGVSGQKGNLSPGADMDLMVWDPDESFTVSTKDLFMKNKISPYINNELYGIIKACYLRGQKTFSHGACSPEAMGRKLLRQEQKYKQQQLEA